MSDLAAVRIHSNTISIFSSRPIISRKRWTDGDWSSVLMAARRSRNASSSCGDLRPLGAVGAEAAGRLGHAPRQAEVHQLLQAVLDVQTHAAERGHQRLDVERLAGARVQEAHQSRAQRRLHKAAKTRLGLIDWRIGAARGRALGCEGEVVHVVVALDCVSDQIDDNDSRDSHLEAAQQC